MKILIIADEVWNDTLHGNNILSNWFNGFDAEFAEVYCSLGKPQNTCCEQYFQLTDAQMFMSLLGKKAGTSFTISKKEMQVSTDKIASASKPTNFYVLMKKLSLVLTTLVYWLRDFIWIYGRYDTVALKSFIDDFKPDVVFCPRLLTPKLMKLEKTINSMTLAPFVAFTADNEVSLRVCSFSPFFWIRRLLFLRKFKKHAPIYSHYFTFSKDQAHEYHQDFGLETSTLYKSGTFPQKYTPKEFNKVIKLIYAGKLYCNRWKMLSSIAQSLKEINTNGVKIILEIYSQDSLTSEMKKTLNEAHSVYFKGRVSPNDLINIYKTADIALHVESIDRINRLKTRISFSTKVIDLMASTCAIMVVCWKEHAAYKYLKQCNAAICLSSDNEIITELNKIAANPDIIKDYAFKAWQCGINNHTTEIIQERLRDSMNEVILKAKS